jgi:hypothetical protein
MWYVGIDWADNRRTFQMVSVRDRGLVPMTGRNLSRWREALGQASRQRRALATAPAGT